MDIHYKGMSAAITPPLTSYLTMCASQARLSATPQMNIVFYSILKFAHTDYFFNCSPRPAPPLFYLMESYSAFKDPLSYYLLHDPSSLYFQSDRNPCLKRHLLVCLLWNFVACIALICVLVIPSKRPFALRSEPEPHPLPCLSWP